jgi:hypothetical protein
MEKELKVCGSCLSGNIGKKFHERDFDMRFKKGHKLAGIDFCLDCGSDDIYTVKNLLDRAREEGRREVYEAIVFDKNIPHDVTTFVAANLWKNMRDKAKEELSKLNKKK